MYNLITNVYICKINKADFDPGLFSLVRRTNFKLIISFPINYFFLSYITDIVNTFLTLLHCPLF